MNRYEEEEIKAYAQDCFEEFRRLKDE